MKLGRNLQIVLALTRLLEDHLKHRLIEPEVELHLEGHEEGDCVTLTVLAPPCHWNLMLDKDAFLHLAEDISPHHLNNTHEELPREDSPQQIAQTVFERITARLPAVTYTPRP